MSPEEIEELLSRKGGGVVRIATINEDGSPLVVPLGYVYRDREILLTARAKVGWLANIRRDRRVCLSVDLDTYPLPKVTIRGNAQIVHEPGEDDLWRDVRMPPPMSDHQGPVEVRADGREEWTLDEAYRQMTHDEPRALVAVPLDEAVVTSWRLPLEGELASEAWASRYYQDDEPQRDFVVSEVGPTMYHVRVLSEPERQ